MLKLDFAKYLLLWFLLGVPMLSNSQTRIVIDSASYHPPCSYVLLHNASFPIHHVQAQALKDSNDAKLTSLEIYNLLIPAATVQALISHSNTDKNRNSVVEPGDTLLIALSVLPNADGIIEWQLISLDTIPTGQLVSLAAIVKEGQQRLAAYRKAGNPQDYRLVSRLDLFPIVKRGGQYWTPKAASAPDSFLAGLPTRMRREWPQVPSPYVLTQYFLIRSYATRYLDRADYVTINIKSPTLAYDAPWRTVRTLLPPKGHYAYSSAMGIVPEGVAKGIFEFWSRPRIGSGVFEYKPGIGLLTGSYNDYFYSLAPSKPRPFFDYILVDTKLRLR